MADDHIKLLNKYLITAVVLAVLSGLYINWPAPELSKQLIEWKNGGGYFKYKNSFNIFYLDIPGEGSPEETLVLVHGFPTSSIDWRKVLGKLKTKFGRIIASDLLGLGFSDKPLDHDYTIFEQADVIQELLRNLKVHKIHILSHDYGDTVAQEILYRQIHYDAKLSSEKSIEVKSICLLNGGVFPDIHTPLWSQTILLNPYLQSILPKLSNYWVFSRQISNTFGNETKPTAEDLKDWWALTRYNEGQNALPGLLDYIPQRRQYRDRWLEALQKTPAKVHFVYGPKDPINPHPFAEHFKKVIPDATIDTVPNAGHFVQWEAPEQMINSFFNFLDVNKIV